MAKRSKAAFPRSIDGIDKAIDTEVANLRRLCNEEPCYSLLLNRGSIDDSLVEDVYDDLRNQFGDRGDCLLVVVHSSGGDIDAAYHLAQLFRRYGTKELTFVIRRWAKSAATLLVCAGDLIQMTPAGELGPVDPQITWTNPLEKRSEQFSPLDINSTLALIRDEYSNGSEKLANALTQRLQFPLTLGSFQKSLEHGEQYLVQLLSTRMFADRGSDKAKEIAHKLTHGYPSHTACITINEAQSMGLKAEELVEPKLGVVWKIFRLAQAKHRIEMEKHRKKVLDLMKEMPKELIEKLPPELRE